MNEKMNDEVASYINELNIKDEYITYNELDITKYNTLYIHDFLPKYRFIRNSNSDLYDLIRKMLSQNNDLNVVLHTSYKKNI